MISIHALREEGDPKNNPYIGSNFGFLSTPSARRATWEHWKEFMGENKISIHALREEGDLVVLFIK